MNIPEVAHKKRQGLRRAMFAWYRREARDLPWRRMRNPYAVWLSEVMLQQTRVDQVVPYFKRFITAFPTVQTLAAAGEDDVMKQWEGLGYYGRARKLHQAARTIVDERGGRLPTTAAGWQTLPGVGRYTAGAIASIAFGERVAVLDGNVIRVLSRVFDVDRCVDDGVTRRYLWALAETLVPLKEPGVFNQAVMELGARICTPREPQCAVCPVRRYCDAFAQKVQDQRPVRRSKKGVPEHEIVVAAIQKNGRYLVGKRSPEGLLGGLWEFPGGKILRGESHERALRREVKEELGIGVRVGEHIATVRHAYTHFRVVLHVYRCSRVAGRLHARTHTELKWLLPSQFERYAFPKANHKFIRLL